MKLTLLSFSMKSPRPAQIITTALLLFVPQCARPQVQSLSYFLEYRPGPPAAVQVTLHVRGESDGTSRLAMAPDWGGVKDCERFVHKLTVETGDGVVCEVSADSNGAHGWDVQHAPDAILNVRYELRPAAADPLASHRTKYEPVVSDTLFHLIGETGLIYPVWLEDQGDLDITLDWIGFREQGWSVVSSHDADSGRIHTSMPRFRHSVFMAGPIQVVDRAIPGGQLRVAIAGNDWSFTGDEFADLVARIVSIERNFFNDESEPYFLVTAVPTGPPVNEQSISMGGTGLTNCFALFLAPGTMLTEGSTHRRHVLHLLAHEYFHTWNGGAGMISLEAPEELGYWLSEGFTDFYASRLLYRAGLFSEQEWVDRLNSTLADLWRNPVRSEPAAIIEHEFWSNPHVRDLPYDRGELVAVMLDEEIRSASGRALSLDEFMRRLLADAREGENAETGRLLERIAKWTSEDFADRLRAIVVDGALPEPPTHVTDPTATLTEAEFFDFDAGFELDESLRTGTVSGVREDGPAFVAGLRDGDVLRGYSVHRGNTDEPVRFTINDHGRVRSVEYYPRGQSLTVPQYELDP